MALLTLPQKAEYRSLGQHRAAVSGEKQDIQIDD